MLLQRKTAVSGLAEGRRVDQPAIGPQGVEAARDTQRGIYADVALKDLAVVTDLANDLVCPVIRQDPVPEP